MIRLSFWIALANFAQLVLGLGRSILLTRWLGVERFGSLGYALAVVGIADVVAQVGLTNIVTREVAARPRADGRLFGTALALRGCFAILAGAAAWWVAGPWAGLLVLGFAGSIGVCILRAKLLRGAQIAGTLLPVALAVAAIAAFGITRPPSAGLALAILACAGAVAAVGQLALARAHLNRPMALSVPAASGLLASSWPLWLSEMLIILYTRMDILMMRGLLPAGEADRAIGYYQVAQHLAEGANLILGALVTVAFPMMAAAQGKPPAVRRRVFGRAMRFGWAAGGVALVAAFALGGWAIRILFGEQWAPSIPALWMLSATFPLALANGILASLLVSAGRQHVIPFMSGALLVFNFAANWFAIPAFGFMGAAASTSGVQLLGLAALWHLSRRVR